MRTTRPPSRTFSPHPRVPDPQAPLQQRDGRRLRLDDDLDRALQQRVLVRVELNAVAVVLERLRQLEQRLVELLSPLGAALLDDQRDLLLADVRALEPLEPRGAERLEEHVPLAEQALGAGLVEDHARVGLALDRPTGR